MHTIALRDLGHLLGDDLREVVVCKLHSNSKTAVAFIDHVVVVALDVKCSRASNCVV